MMGFFYLPPDWPFEPILDAYDTTPAGEFLAPQSTTGSESK